MTQEWVKQQEREDPDAQEAPQCQERQLSSMSENWVLVPIAQHGKCQDQNCGQKRKRHKPSPWLNMNSQVPEHATPRRVGNDFYVFIIMGIDFLIY